MNPQPKALVLADALEELDVQFSHTGLCGEAADELRRLHAVNADLLETLEKLARLGNGEHYGNSDGNMIARAAIAKATGGEA